MKIALAPGVFAANAKTSALSLLGQSEFDRHPRPARFVELAAPDDLDFNAIGTNVIGGSGDNFLISDGDDAPRVPDREPHVRKPPPVFVGASFRRIVVALFSVTFGLRDPRIPLTSGMRWHFDRSTTLAKLAYVRDHFVNRDQSGCHSHRCRATPALI